MKSHIIKANIICRNTFGMIFPSQTIPANVPDAHFDWNNSGLTNPLDSCKYMGFCYMRKIFSNEVSGGSSILPLKRVWNTS